MTSRQLYEALLIELNKKGTTALLLSEFNHYANKAFYQTINKEYNQYEITLLLTDGLRVLKATAKLKPIDNTPSDDGYYVVVFPDDYFHILKCVCQYTLKNPVRSCESEDLKILHGAKRLTSDSWSLVMENYYHRPTIKRPYYYINNVNTDSDLPTNPIVLNGEYLESGTDTTVENTFPRFIKVNNNKVSTVDRVAGQRYGNVSKVRCEIYCGNDDRYELTNVNIDYLKTPLTINLTLRLLDLVDDDSQILELPDYMCNEMLNELVTLIMEKTVDPRLQTHSVVTLTIASPVLLLTTK